MIEHAGPFGGFFITQDEGEKAEENFGEGFNAGKRYTLRVGDLCYVALGQIVNRPYTAVRYQPTAIIYATSVPHCKPLRADLLKEWGGLTAEKHRDSLAKDLGSDSEYVRAGRVAPRGVLLPGVRSNLSRSSNSPVRPMTFPRCSFSFVTGSTR